MPSWKPVQPCVYGIFFPGCKSVYVGSAGDRFPRWNEHLRLLRKGKHNCTKMQAAFVAEGERAMIFRVLEWVDLEPVDTSAGRVEMAEARWISHYISAVGRARVLNRSLVTWVGARVAG